jgi:hypothetical protein
MDGPHSLFGHGCKERALPFSENRTPVVQTVICEYLRSHGHPTSVVLQPPPPTPHSTVLAPFIFRSHACFRYSFISADLSVGPDILIDQP